MNSDRSLHDTDFFEWTKVQADRLRSAMRSGVNLPLDWENIAEEIEALGRSERGELSSRIQTIIEHLLKLECSPALLPRNGWKATVQRNRLAIAEILENSPSLRRKIEEIVRKRMAGARKVVALELADYREPSAVNVADYTPDQVIGEWFPDLPHAEP
jgi:hypothetical protein